MLFYRHHFPDRTVHQIRRRKIARGGKWRLPDRPAHQGRAQGCIGCGRPTRLGVCRDCQHSDWTHGTLVLAPGQSCPICGAVAVRPLDDVEVPL